MRIRTILISIVMIFIICLIAIPCYAKEDKKTAFYKRFVAAVNVLEKNGIKAIDEANVPFDPSFHQAIMTEKRDGVEPEMILEVLQKGYLLKDKVIRPAMVKVSE